MMKKTIRFVLPKKEMRRLRRYTSKLLGAMNVARREVELGGRTNPPSILNNSILSINVVIGDITHEEKDHLFAVARQYGCDLEELPISV